MHSGLQHRVEQTMEVKSSFRVNGGTLLRISHPSACCKCPMTFGLFLPASTYISDTLALVRPDARYSLLFYLSGLTCTDENACQKLGAFPALAEAQMACVFPDTSPRGCGVSGEADSWDFGVGAGFFLDATQVSTSPDP